MNRPHRGTVIAIAFALAACAGPTGPVLGDWRGDTPGPVQFYGETTELVLDGTPEAASGRYHQAVTIHNPLQLAGNGTQIWAGEWTRESAPDGRPVFVLHDNLPGRINRYELAADGTLRALPPAGAPGATAGAQLYTLFPLKPGWGYGRV